METITHRTGYGPGKGLEAYLADQLKDIDTSIQNRLVSEIIDLANKARDLERASHELRMVESDLRFTREKTDYSTEAARSRSVEAMRSKSQSAKDNHTKAAALVETAIKAVMDGGAALRTKVSDYEARLTLFKTPAHRPFLMTHASPTPARPMLFRATSE